MEWVVVAPAAQVGIGRIVVVLVDTPLLHVGKEGGKLVGLVFVDTDRPIADYVSDAKREVANRVQWPSGIRVEWVGQFKYLERAKQRVLPRGGRDEVVESQARARGKLR